MPLATPLLNLEDPWRSFLREIDEELPLPTTVHCMGGFVVANYYGCMRRTEDLDCLTVVPKDSRILLESLGGILSARAKKYKIYIQHVGIADYPEDYDTRLSEMNFGFQKLNLLALDPYDLLLAKLTANRPVDRDDVRVLAQHLSLKFSILQQRFDAEMKPWLPNLARHELTLQLWKEYFAE